MRRLRLALATIAALLMLCVPAHAAYLAGWGTNNHLQMGTGYKSAATTVPVPTIVPHPVTVVTGGEWGAALVEGGQVWTWGGNESGQAGNGKRGPYKATPSAVAGLTGVVELAGNGEHLIARLANGEVRVWGSDKYGQECDGHEGKVPVPLPDHGKPWAVKQPIAVPGVTDATSVEAGGANTLIVKADGTALGCGEDAKEQLGDHSKLNKDRPVRLPVEGIARGWVGGAAASGGHVLLETRTGQVYGLGLNDFGQIGDGTTTNRGVPTVVKGLIAPADVSAGPDHNLAVLQNGQVLAWGDDEYGQLGAPAPSKCGPIKAQVSCATVTQPVGLTGQLAVAGTHFSLVTSSGRLYSFGQNRWATLGNGTRTDSHTPSLVEGVDNVTGIAAGYFNAFAITGNHVTPLISIASEHGALTVNWVSTDMHDPWHLAIRPVGGTFGKAITLQPAARSYQFPEAAGEYEIRVSGKAFGVKTATGNAE